MLMEMPIIAKETINNMLLCCQGPYIAKLVPLRVQSVWDPRKKMFKLQS